MNKKNPWQVIEQKAIYENPWINVTEYDVINPSGRNGIYGKVHFKGNATGILVLDENLNTVLVGQFRFVLNEYSWEIPEGGGPVGTDPLESAKRELKEETGLVADAWTFLMRIYLSNSVTDEVAHIYLARQLSQKEASPDETEQLAIKRLPFEEAYKMVQEGAITDSISVCAILKVKLMLLYGEIS